MVYSHATLNFDESNILNIKGYNNSGKSAILKAVIVCMLNMYSKSQTKFIRHGEKYFRIVIRFNDGVAIVKDKYIDGQTLYEVYKNDECIFTTKEGRRLTRIDGVPKEIEDYLGLCMVGTGCLNYQVRQDPLWLIDTTGGDNYNSLNEILKAVEIARATTLINSDRNEINSEITKIEASLQETKLALLEAKSYSDELLSNLEKREEYCKDLSNKYRELKSLVNIAFELSEIKDIPALEGIDSKRYDEINAIYSNAVEVSEIVIYPEVEKCDCSRLEAISNIYNSAIVAQDVVIPPEVETIDTDCVSNLTEIVDLLKQVDKVVLEIKQLDAEKDAVVNTLENIVSSAKEQGIDFIKCDTCGTYIEVKR